LGVLFIMDNLIEKLPKNIRQTALKKDRMTKWYKMISYGLDSDISHKVIDKKRDFLFDDEEIQPISFTPYAKIGLQNFFETNPELFLSRLAKGPPPQYRWLAWSFIASRLITKIKGKYN
jgi:hypothetical protein